MTRKRREVFEDTGLGGGGSLMAALWSELWRLQRERTDEIGWKATGTGVVVEQRRGKVKASRRFLSHRSWLGRNEDRWVLDLRS